MRRDHWFLILGGVLYILVYWHRLLLRPMMPFDGNMIRLFYPTWEIGRKMLADGFHFLWNPYFNMGQPFLADPQTQALYPLRFLSLFLNFLDYERIFVVFHVLLASSFAFLLAKNLFKDDLPGLFAALAMGFNGFSLARVTLPPHFAAMAWVPAALFFLQTRRPVALGITLALQWMAGFPPFFILTVLMLFIFSFISNPPKGTLTCFTGGLITMLGLAAVQWIPFLEMLKHSARPLVLSGPQAFEYSLHPVELLRQLTLPSFVLPLLKPITNADQAIIHFYFGPVFLLLFWVGFWYGGKREKILTAMTAGAFVLSLGEHTGFYPYIPFITIFRFPAHWILVGTVGFALVGAFGLKVIKNAKARFLIFGLVALDLLVHALPMHTPWGDNDFFSQPAPLISGLSQTPQNSRVFHTSFIIDRVHNWEIKSKKDWLLMKGMLVPSIGAGHGIKETASFSVLTSRRHLAFLNRLDMSPATSPLYDYAGISKIVSLSKEALSKPVPEWEDVRVIENPDFRPNLFMELGSPVKMVNSSPGHYVAEAQGPGKLVLSVTYEPGWRVWVNGEVKPISVFEDAFPAVELGEGNHKIRFEYKPFSFRMGLIVSLLTALLLMIRRFLSVRAI